MKAHLLAQFTFWDIKPLILFEKKKKMSKKKDQRWDYHFKLTVDSITLHFLPIEILLEMNEKNEHTTAHQKMK